MKKRRLNPTAIGAFVLGAVAIAVASIVLFGSGRWFGGERVSLVCFFEDDVDGMQIGSKVKLKGVPIGEVKNILLRFKPNPTEGEARTKPLIPVIIEVDVDRLSNDLGVNMDFRDDRQYREHIEDGLRATLGISSLITGILQVNLDYHDDAEKAEGLEPFIYRGVEYRIIPTMPSQMAQATNDLLSVVNNISTADFKGVVEGLNTLLDNVNDKLSQFEVKGMNEAIESFQTRMESPKFDEALASFSKAMDAATEATKSIEEVAASLKKQLGEDTLTSAITSADESFEALTGAINNLNEMVQSSKDVPAELTTTLKDFSDMAKEIEQLAAQIKEDPNSIIFGKEKDRTGEAAPANAKRKRPWERSGR